MNQRGGLEPSDALKLRILGLSDPLTLDELFTDGQGGEVSSLDHLRKVARLKIIGVFRIAGEVSREVTRRPASASYILPGDGTAEQLVAAITRVMKGSHDFVKTHDLPPVYRGLATQWRNSVRAHVRYLLLLEAVKELEGVGAQLWYFQGEQRWQAAQSLIDEYERLLREAKGWYGSRPELPFNRRPWHGRPARDRRRAVMPGTSVGYAA
jgi:hypothetical protein